jgi:integrase
VPNEEIEKQTEDSETEDVMGNKPEQPNRGKWVKDKVDRGLLLRGRVWYVRYTDQTGRIQVERVGPSKAYAAKVYRLRKGSVMERRFVPASGVMWDELVDDVVAIARRRHSLTRPEREFKAGNYNVIREWFKGRKAESISTQEIAAQLKRAKTAATFNRLRVAVSHTFKIGIENKKAVENPALRVRMLKEDNERIRYLNQFRPDEETALRQAIRETCPDREAELDLALFTGMRWAEQYRLAWANVDLKKGQIQIEKGKSSGKAEHIPINSGARTALAKLRALSPKSELVCPGNDYWHNRNLWFIPALEKAKIDDFRWHDLRHTFATRLILAGVDIYTVSKLMRHKNIQTTMRYAHLTDSHLRDATEKMVAGVTGGVTAPALPKTAHGYVN